MGSRHHLHLRRRQVERGRRRTLYVLAVVVVLTLAWGALIPLSYLVPAISHLSAKTSWVSTISYYANAVGGCATAAALSAKLTAHDAHDQSIENAERLHDAQQEPW